MKRILLVFSFLFCLSIAGFCRQKVSPTSLNKQAAKEYLKPIRPASEGRNPCWNGFCRKFIYAPAFDAKTVDGAVKYKFTVRQKTGDGQWSFIADSPTVDLSAIWGDIVPSYVQLTIEGLDAQDVVVGIAFQREFLRDFPFEGPYNDKVRTYRESALMAALYIHRMTGVQDFLKSCEPDLDKYNLFTYPNKIIGGLISVEAIVAANVPELREEALTIARNAASFLIAQSRPEGDPLAFFPPTYHGDKLTSKKACNVGKMMTMDACYATEAFLDLFDACGDSLYFDRAIKITDTFSKIQREDGSFPIKVDFVTGEPVNNVGAMQHPILNIVRRFQNQYGIHKYDEMAVKGENWMKAVALETFDLTGQFEDVSVEGLKPYQNLTNCTAAPFASYMLLGSPSRQDIEDAKDLIRLSEDQFVHWNEIPNGWGIKVLGTPCVFEQHNFQVPVDASSCNVANAYLDLFAITGDQLAFAKAKALIDNLTIAQEVNNGRIPTLLNLYPPQKNMDREFWINCCLHSIKTLMRISALTEQQH